MLTWVLGFLCFMLFTWMLLLGYANARLYQRLEQACLACDTGLKALDRCWNHVEPNLYVGTAQAEALTSEVAVALSRLARARKLCQLTSTLDESA